MGNLEQAAANMFHQEEMHELSFSSTESKRFPTFELEARLPAKRGQTTITKKTRPITQNAKKVDAAQSKR